MEMFILVLVLVDNLGLASVSGRDGLTWKECNDAVKVAAANLPVRPGATRTRLHASCIPVPPPGAAP